MLTAILLVMLMDSDIIMDQCSGHLLRINSFKKRTSFNSESEDKYVLTVFNIFTRLNAQ